MDEQSTELQDSSELVVDSETVQPSSEPQEDVEALKANNAKLYARLKKTEAALKAVTGEEPQPQINHSPDDKLTRLELKTDGYKNEEIDFIMKNGGPSAVNDPFVKAAIDVMRSKSKSEDAIPEGSPKSPVYQKFTEQDLQNMSTAELEKLIPRG